jgi:hypothetical protein
VSQQKLEGYLLNPDHNHGRHKARVFSSALGITAADWRHLQEAILAGVRNEPVSAIVATPYGLRCTVVVPIEGLNGKSHDVCTAWLVAGDEPPRLVTAYMDL